MQLNTRLAAAAVLVAGVLCAPLAAQEQPEVARNAQDEVININREVPPDVSRFTVFRSGDKAEINTYVSHVIELEHAPGIELLPYISRAVALEKGSARPLRYTDPETGERREFLHVITTEQQMHSIIETIRAMDLPEVRHSTGLMQYHYRMRYRRASEVAAILEQTILMPESKATADDVSNTLYIADTAGYAARNIATAQFYDVPPPQVEFEVLAVEIEEADADKLGVDWDAWKRSVGGQFGFTASSFEGGDHFARLDTLVTIDAEALASFLNYTVRTGTGQTVTRSKVTASNQRPGVVSSLQRIPSFGYTTVLRDGQVLREETTGVRTTRGSHADAARTAAISPPSRSFLTDTSEGTARPGATARDPSLFDGEKSEGIYLEILPTIGTDMVTADLRVVVNSLTGYTRLDQPIIAERLIDTSLTLKNNEPFAIGGLDKETRVEQRSGIPLLKDIPGVKYLFSTKTDTARKSRIFMVITPQFNSQVLYKSRSLTGSRLDEDPPHILNPDVPIADYQDLLFD